MLASIETTGRACGVALFDGGELLVELRSEIERAHDRLLGTFFRDALKTAGAQATDIDTIAISSGPGSYTGIRIGVSFAIGFAHALDIPLTPVPTLDSIAWSVRSDAEIGGRSRILSLIPDLRGGLYAALYDVRTTFRPITAPYDIAIEEIGDIIDENIVAAGPGVAMLDDSFGDCVARDSDHLTAEAIGQYGSRLFWRGSTVHPDQIEPIYVGSLTSVAGTKARHS
jgi:tRNA threonylcarbamoyladenosine biosynthesis protein TsaB